MPEERVVVRRETGEITSPVRSQFRPEALRKSISGKDFLYRLASYVSPVF